MAFTPEEEKIWEKQNIKEKEQEIYEKSYKVNDEEDELEFLDENE
ncbi:hypothetical protein LCGC14_3129470 [marine sediment metagenome]|uniref:Uncharacterized protein n=1 Tax=marine sediment metagenome TaxID=412755 RepID=A0A0F8W059_9ZZZZ